MKPKYNKDALLRAIDNMEKNIKMFEAEIVKLRETIIEYKVLSKEAENNGSDSNI